MPSSIAPATAPENEPEPAQHHGDEAGLVVNSRPVSNCSDVVGARPPCPRAAPIAGSQREAEQRHPFGTLTPASRAATGFSAQARNARPDCGPGEQQPQSPRVTDAAGGQHPHALQGQADIPASSAGRPALNGGSTYGLAAPPGEQRTLDHREQPGADSISMLPFDSRASPGMNVTAPSKAPASVVPSTAATAAGRLAQPSPACRA